MKTGLTAGLSAAAFALTLSAVPASAQDRLTGAPADGPGSFIGVTIAELTDDAAKPGTVPGGVVIERVQAGGPAARAGFQSGDVVVEFDGESVRGARQFVRLVRETPPNRPVDAIVVRGGARQTLRVTPELGRAATPLTIIPPGSAPALRRGAPFTLDLDSFSPEGWFLPSGGRLGAAVMPLDDQLAGYFGVMDGVLVTSVAADSPASRAGLKAGDVIVEVAGRRIAETAEVVDAVRAATPGSELEIGIVRDKQSMTLKVMLPRPERPRVLRNGVVI
jgi:serine protease Do